MWHETFTFTTDSAGAGTAVLGRSRQGVVHQVRLSGTAVNNSGSADYTITSNADGGTVLAVSNVDGPWQYAPRQPVSNLSGATALSATGGTVMAPVAIDGDLTLVVAQAKASTAGTVHIYICGE